MSGPSSQSAVRTLVLLRGINVGGRHVVPMARLCLLFIELGCTKVSTYIQSGNLVCTAPASLAAAQISAVLEERFGFAIPVTLRTKAELSAAITANPFLAAGLSPEALHVLFLAAPLEAGAFQALSAKCVADEQVAARGREIFLALPEGVGRSKLAMACTAANVPGSPTMRNWRTVLQLQAMLQA